MILTVDYSIESSLYPYPEDPTSSILIPLKRTGMMQLDLSTLKWMPVPYGPWERYEQEGKHFLDVCVMQALMERPDLLIPILREHPKIYFIGQKIYNNDRGFCDIYPCICRPEIFDSEWQGLCEDLLASSRPVIQGQGDDLNNYWVVRYTSFTDWDNTIPVPYYEMK